jgi:hypothetical protein
MTSTSDAKEVARVMSEIYDETLDYMLEQYPWSFAKAAVELADSGTPSTASGWQYKYALPVDFLQVVSLNNTDVTDKDRVNFEIMGNEIFASTSTAYLKYIKRETVVGRFTAKFINALSYALARDVAKTLSDETSHIQMLDDKAEQALAEAKAMDGRKNRMPPVSRYQYPSDSARRTVWY